MKFSYRQVLNYEVTYNLLVCLCLLLIFIHFISKMVESCLGDQHPDILQPQYFSTWQIDVAALLLVAASLFVFLKAGAPG